MARKSYGAELDRLDQAHASGQLSDSRYELAKQLLIAEAKRADWPFPLKFLMVFATVLALLVTLAVIGRFFEALG